MKKILFSFVTIMMGIMLFSSCANEDQLGVDKYRAYQENFEKVFGKVNPNQNFNTQKTVTIQTSVTNTYGNYTLRIYDGKPGKKGTSLLGKFENLNAATVSNVKVGISKSIKNIYCVADNGTLSSLTTVAVPASGRVTAKFDDHTVPVNPNGPSVNEVPNTVTIAFEDLGAADDFDFNDVVLTVDYITGARTATVTLQALGGVLPVRLSYVSTSADFSKELFEGKELHEAMGYDTNTLINTNFETKGSFTGVDNVEPITDVIDVRSDFTIGEDGAPFVIIVSDQEGQRQITAETEAGRTPQVLVMGKIFDEDENAFFSWIWPKERVSILDAYPDITDWFNNPDNVKFIAHPNEDLLYDGYNPNQGENPVEMETVDLGLPSGTLWANMNIGATSPEDYGDYFAWGETATKTVYDAESYLYCDAGDQLGDNHQNLGDCISGTNYDVATTLGDDWMMPTSTQFDELLTNCTVTYTTQNGVNGWKFISKNNNNSIFLPEAGDFEGTNCGGEYGTYWSGTMSDSESAAEGLILMEDSWWGTSEIPRIYGCTVRPVKAGTPKMVAIDLALPSGTLWSNMNIGATAPEDFGDYYAWGETATKTVYDAESYLYCDAGEQFGTNHRDLGDCISKTIYDVVYVNSEGTSTTGYWQMPTSAQFNELTSKCTVTYTTQNGVRGWKFTGTNNNSIFLPEAGDFESTYCGGEYGSYWSGTMSETESAAEGLILMEDSWWGTSEIPRIYGCTVRPVFIVVP